MTPIRLPLFTLLLVALAALPAGVRAQTSEQEPKPFERKYIDASEYRGDQTMLHDWPALTRLVVWTRGLESAVSGADQTLSAELLAGFRARVDSLRSEPLPDFLAGRADSVQTAIGQLAATLDQAEASLSAVQQAIVTPRGGVVSAGPGSQRTLVTGGTAVTVPAGVAVGSERDSLPTVAFEAGGSSMTFVDRVALALLELDRVVHLTRAAGSEASRSPTEREATPAPGTPPPRPGP